MNTHSKSVMLAFLSCIVLFSMEAFAGTKIIDYGFEDYVGENGNASPAPGYIFGTSYQEYWDTHLATSEVVQNGDSDCAGDAYEGTHYIHFQKYTGGYDPCLNGTATSVNARANISASQFGYPSGTKDTARISNIVSNILTVRLQFRATGSWKSGQGGLDGGAGHKFIRVYGGNGSGDDSSAILKLSYDSSDPTPRMIFYVASVGNAWREVGVDWQDGNWHAIVFQVVRNNNTNSSNNVTMNLWVDDWGMEGSPVSITGTAGDMGSSWSHIAFSSNWSAQYPATFMGYDIDNIEVWDGMPTGPNPPKNLRKVPTP